MIIKRVQLLIVEPVVMELIKDKLVINKVRDLAITLFMVIVKTITSMILLTMRSVAIRPNKAISKILRK